MKINNREELARLKTASKGLSLSMVSALAMLTLSGQAVADDATIKLYGNLDTGIEHLTNVGPGKDSVTRIPGITGTMASRLGVKVSKDVGDGYQAFAVMELGASPDDGTLRQGGRIFGRQLNMGLQTPAGRFTIGRQYSPFLFATGDLMGPNIYALGSLDAYLPNARMDNSVSWSNKFGGGFSAAVAYSFGRDTEGAVPLSGTCSGEDTQADESSACRQVAASLKYKGDGFSISAGIDKQNGGAGAEAYFFNGRDVTISGGPHGIDMSDPGDTDTRTTLSGSFNLGDATIGLGVLKRKLDTDAQKVESDTVYVSARYKASPKTTINAGVYSITNDDQDADATLYVVRALYNLDKGVDWYAQVGGISNSDNATYALSPGAKTGPAPGESQTGIMVGFRFKY
jgi:predicted porin